MRASGVTDMRTLDASMPFGRVCQPEDVADVVRFFCSSKAGYLTGEKLYVHGGGFVTGSYRSELYDGRAFARRSRRRELKPTRLRPA